MNYSTVLPSRTHHLRSQRVCSVSQENRPEETQLVSDRCHRLSSLGLPTQLTERLPRRKCPRLEFVRLAFSGARPPEPLRGISRTVDMLSTCSPARMRVSCALSLPRLGAPLRRTDIVSCSLFDVPESQTLNFHGAGSESDVQITPLSPQGSLFLGLRRAAGFPPSTEGLGQRGVLS